jgi:hypothetical protein
LVYRLISFSEQKRCSIKINQLKTNTMKKILTLLTLLSIFWNLSAQNNLSQLPLIQNGLGPVQTSIRNVTDVNPADIQFWVGSGSNQMIAVFYWCQDSAIGVAYGYRWDGVRTIGDMLYAIDTADARFSVQMGSWINSYSYLDATYNLHIAADGMLSYTLNGVWANGLTDPLSNNGIFEMEEYGNCTTPSNIVMASNPNTPSLPNDANIPFDQIDYWVGGGSNSAVLTINWCDTAIAFGWGVHFEGDSILVADLMRTVAIYDPRINFSYGNWGITDITFQDGNYNLSLSGDWWIYNVNGQSAMLGIDAQYIHNGDIVKWGDESCGIADPNFNYVWTTPIQPIYLGEGDNQVYDGIVGSSHYLAISYDNNAILGWATGCQVTRGYQDIANPIVLASYGAEQNGVGPASESTTDVVSLGDHGSAVLTFSTPIVNTTGYDFAVFENSLNDVFLELAFVEVSSDGINYFRFPSVSNSQNQNQVSNSGTLDATHIHNLAGKHRAGWGTLFDLDDLSGYYGLNINNITHVRIVDVVGSIDPQYGTTDRYGNIINDPYPTDFASGGFDLGGVAVLNGYIPEAIDDYNTGLAIQVYPNPCTEYLMIDNQEGKQAVLYNALGQIVMSSSIRESIQKISMGNIPGGLYILQIGTEKVKIIKK